MIPPGTMLGRYEIRERIGAGGMGDVYAAHDPTLGRQVAVKVLAEALASDADRLARFGREAKAASALNHPSILTVFDFGEHLGTHFLVTELVDGRTLREWATGEQPSLAEMLDVIAQVALALGAAHAAGIVHRDVKPENLMLRPDGFVKVLDFGIAKLLVEPGSTPDTAGHTDPNRATMPGTILGTTRYMSPEQALGAAVDARSDVWSLGVVLYELLASKPPFEAPTSMGTLAMILGREPEPLDVAAPGTPEAVCRIVARALRKQAAERFETAREMAAELARAAQGLETGVAAAAETGALSTQRFELKPAPSPPTNLPPRASALIGRERELDEVTRLLGVADVRLVTLTGPGGSGKTRLAVEVGRHMLSDFADGVFAVDLSSLGDPDRIAAHVAAELGLKESPERSLAEELEHYLAHKRMLLVLDNFEHLLAGASVVLRLLGAAPGLTVLVTSRAPLHLQREREVEVEPLEVPAFTSLPSLDELARSPAVALFVDRAHATKSSFALTTENARTVVEICRRLDGLPLAIELAAARVRLLSPAAMLERLEHQLKLLTGGARDLPSRQQTMRGAVAWSYDLLDEHEQGVLRRMAVFVGGATLEAAEAVCGWGEEDVLEAVGSLVDKNLLKEREQADGEVRFTMLEVVREFAAEQLETSGEAERARLAHARWFHELARQAEPKVSSAEDAEWIGRLARDADNLTAAMTAMLEREPDEGAAFVADLNRYSMNHSSHRQNREWHKKALERGAGDPATRSRLMSDLCLIETYLGNLSVGVSTGNEAVEMSRALGDPALLLRALANLGIALSWNDPAAARVTVEEALGLAREIGDTIIESRCLGNLGEAARRMGDLQAARAYNQQFFDSAGFDLSLYAKCVALINLGGISLEEDDAAGAAPNYRGALELASGIRQYEYAAYALDGLAAVDIAAGELGRAALLSGAAGAIYEALGVKREPSEQALRERNEAELRARLDAETLDRELARGRAMSFEEVARVALGND